MSQHTDERQMNIQKKEPGEEILKMDFNVPYEGKEITHQTMMHPGGRKSVSLNGMWNFEVDLYHTALRKRFFEEQYYDENGNEYPLDYDFDDWQKVMVPFCFNTFQEEFFWYEGNAVFTRKFRHHAENGQRVFLKVSAANYESKVFLNKTYLGSHLGGYTPYYIEITPYLQTDNRIIIMADNTRKWEGVPAINTDWFNYGGLQRDIELIYTPESYIKDYFVYLKNDDTYQNIMCEIETVGDGDVATVEIEELGIQEQVNLCDQKARLNMNAAPILWDIDNPKLYEIKIAFGDDVVTDLVGFRQIATVGKDVLLNGRKVFMRGICAHEESATNGRALTDDERMENLMLAKELGCNAMRLAHYPHHENMARMADRLGILLWEEIPVYWALQFSNPETYRNAENQLSELVLRDRNRASVIIWSVGNENPDSDQRLSFMRQLSQRAKKLDPTRLTAAACLVTHTTKKIEDRLAEYIDIIGINEYYGWYDRNLSDLERVFENSKDLSKPLFITETGGGALSGHHGCELYTEDYQSELYQNQIAIMKKYQEIQGFFPWNLYDFRTPVRLGKFQKRYNRKGLLNPEKTYRKRSFYTLQAYYRELS